MYEFGDRDGQPYFVMEYVPGDTVADIITREPTMSLAQRLRWMEALCAAVVYAHQRGVIHGDIRPANLPPESPVAQAPRPARPRQSKRPARWLSDHF